jgi:hypothetical protein
MNPLKPKSAMKINATVHHKISVNGKGNASSATVSKKAAAEATLPIQIIST